MDAIVAANTVPLSQVSAAPAGTPGYPTDGNPDTGVLPTDFPAYHYAGIIRELLGLITGAGLTPDRNNTGQVLAAVQALVGGPNAAEAAARVTGDNAEAQARANADTAEATARANADTAEAQARVAGDAATLATAEAFASGLVTGSVGSNPAWVQLTVGAASPSGVLLLQWGVSSTGLSGTPGAATDVINFPRPFTACMNLQLTVANAHSFVGVTIADGPLGPAQVVVETTRTTDGGPAPQIQYNWFAVGY